MAIERGRLGNTIREARIRKGYTQEYLAEKLDITPGHLQHMECGRRNPSVPMLFQMMELLEFSVDAIVFPQEVKENVVYVGGLTEKQIEAVIRLVDTMKQ